MQDQGKKPTNLLTSVDRNQFTFNEIILKTEFPRKQQRNYSLSSIEHLVRLNLLNSNIININIDNVCEIRTVK